MLVMPILCSSRLTTTRVVASVNTDGTSVSVDIRTASGHVTPSLYSATSPVLANLTQSTNATGFIVTFVCSACTSWSSGALATYQENGLTTVIHAEGSVNSAGNLAYHGNNYGISKVNLTDGGLDAASTAPMQSHVPMSNVWWIAHAVFVTVGFLGVYGVGIVFAAFLQVKHRIRYHYIIQSTGSLIGIIGIALGLKYAAGKPLEGAHQTLGIVLFAFVFAQAALGTVQHVCYKQGILSLPYIAARYAHRLLGSVFLVGVVINAGLGMLLPMVGVPVAGAIVWYVIMALCLMVYWVMRLRVLMRANLRSATQRPTNVREEESKQADYMHEVPS